MSAKTFITSLAILGLASAQSSVISVFIPDTDPQPLVASIIGNDATATTYFLNCPVGTDGSDCGMGPGMTYFSGPKTVGWSIDSPEEDFSAGIFCSVGPITAVCTTTASGSGANDPGVSSDTTSVTDMEQELIPITITAGSITPVSASASATATATGAVTSVSGAASTSTAATTPAREASSPEASASKTSTGSSTFATSAASASSTKASGTAVAAASTGAGSHVMANAKLVMGLGAAIVAGVVAAM